MQKNPSAHSMSMFIGAAVVGVLVLQVGIASQVSSTTTRAQDPGVRAGGASAGAPLPGLTAQELEYFNAGQADFNEVETIADGIGPRMNLDSCGGCHAQPASGGSSPAVNPQVAFAHDGGRDE